jgi:thiol-disulfide isomerase/thioredoxin
MKKSIILTLILVLFLSVSASAVSRMVLGENFTNTSCGPCAPADPYLENMIEEYGHRFSLVRYHVYWPNANDPFYVFNPGEINVRINYYGVTGVPNLHLDGIIDGQSYYTNWQNLMLSRIDVSSPLVITVKGDYYPGSREGSLDISVQAVSTVSGTDLRLMVALIESGIYYPGGNGISIHNQTLRDLIPTATGEAFTISNGETKHFDKQFTVDPQINDDSCDIVVWVQDYPTKEVHQTARRHLMNMTGIDDLPQGDIPENISLIQNYPNPFNAVTTIAFNLDRKSSVDLSVYNIYGQKVATLAGGIHAAGYHAVKWDASDEASGVYFYRLEASGEVLSKRMILMK